MDIGETSKGTLQAHSKDVYILNKSLLRAIPKPRLLNGELQVMIIINNVDPYSSKMLTLKNKIVT